MVKLSIAARTLHVEMQGHHRFWALRSKLSVPLADIREVRHDPARARRFWKGLKAPGTDIPGVYTAGTFYQGDWRPDFWSVRRPENAIVIRCARESAWDEIIVEVEDPAKEVERLRKALATKGGR